MLFPSLVFAAVTSGSSVPITIQSPSSLDVSVHPVDATSAPRGSSRVKALTIDLQASCTKAVKVSAIDISVSGFGDTEGIVGIFAADGFTRISRSVHVEAQERVAHLRTPSLTIDACTKKTVDVYMSLSPTVAAGSEYRLSINKYTDVQTDAGIIDFSQDQPSGSISTNPVSAPLITVQFLSVPARASYGTIGTLSRFTLTNAGDRPVSISSIILTNEGTSRDTDFADVHLERTNGITVTANTSIVDKKVTLIFTMPLRLERSDAVVLLLKGKIQGSAYRTVQFLLQEAGDITSTITR